MKYLIWITLYFLSQAVLGQQYTLSGYIRDESTGENLIGATVYDAEKQLGTTTNYYGFYSLTLPQGALTLTISYIGYSPKTLEINLNGNISQNISLSSDIRLDEITITGEVMESQKTQMSTVNIKTESIKTMPSLMGEADVLKTLQLLPGVQSGSEGSSGLYVRGGGADQNLILLDGVPVYNASHLFGFFSVFNADAINNVELIKGGFPARYGGRLSSVIDINLKEGNKEKIHGEGSIGLISSKLTLDGPIGKKTTFLLSGRRTYIDLLTRPITRAATDGNTDVGYYFYDFNGKINHTISDKDRIYLSAYTGLDKAYAKGKYEFDGLKSEEEAGLDWGNVTTAFRWNHVFNPKLFGNLTATYSKYKFNIEDDLTDEVRDSNGQVTTERETIEYFSLIEDVGAKIDMEYALNPRHRLMFGGSFTYHVFKPGVLAFKSNVSDNDTTLGPPKRNSGEYYVYAEDQINVNDRLFFNAGVHFSGFSTEGTTYTSLQPRLSARYTLNATSSLKASYVRMTQYIHLLTNASIGLPTDLWVPATSKIKPQDAIQYAVGYAKDLKGGFSFSTEAYYKEMRNLIEYREGASYLSINDNWEDKVTVGEGTSYGLELLLKKNTGRLNGWVGYTWSKTFRTFPEINGGKEFPYTYDRRHDLSINMAYDLKEGVKLSSTWVYGSGNSITLPISKYKVAPVGERYSDGVRNYGGKNSFRMRPYHRLDVAIAWTKQMKRWKRTWTLGAYNVYSRANPFYVDLGRERNTGELKFIQYSLFPILPFFRYSISF